jgi:two-component sensor histidine kinase
MTASLQVGAMEPTVLERWRKAIWPWRYPFAAIVVAAACGLYLLSEDLVRGLLFITFFPAIFAVALLAGWRAGVVAVLLSLFLVWWIIMPPAFEFAFSGPQFIRLAALAGAGGLLLWMAALLEENERKARREAERANLLFRELRHRVGNILQLCSALLRLRAQGLDAEGRAVITDAAAQLVAMQRIHDRIAGAGETVGLEPALRELCDVVAKLSPGLRFELRCNGVALPRDHLIPVGLIVHELLNNAVEHGLKGELGAVTVEVLPDGNGGWQLSVTDDGPGLPDGFSVDGSPRQGLKIVQALAQQAEASFTLQNRLDGRGVRAELASRRATA